MTGQASGCWDTVVSKTDLFLLSKSLKFDGDGGGLEIIIMQACGKLQTMMRAPKESSREF